MASKLEADLHCPVCYDIFKDPVILTCTHSVCKACLQQFWQTKPSRECPVCRTISAPQDEPLTNLILKNLCESLVKGKGERALTGSEVRCRPHNKKLKVFCREDRELVCLLCRDSKQHRNHHFCTLEEAVLEHKRKIETNLKPIKEQLKAFKEAKIISDKTATKIKTQAQQTEKHIKDEFEKLHQFLREEEAARIAALREEEEQKSEMMKEKIEKMGREISSLSDTIRTIEEEMGADDVSFMLNYNTTVERAQCTLQYPEKVTGPLLHVAKHLNNLRFRVWEKMQDMIEYAPVTLDPNTAHPRLILSEDLTSVKWGDEQQQLPDNPERFDEYASVLGSEGFDSGTHCWDVEVGDSNEWDVGVMAESGQRRGRNMDENVSKRWIVRHSNNEYTARSGMVSFLRVLFNRSDIPLTVEQNPQRIRVKLDRDRGRVSFSDPDNDTHLHTFTHTFTERVFPYFNSTFPMKILRRKPAITVEQHRRRRGQLKCLPQWRTPDLKAYTCLNGNEQER
ncbi:zinc-binding protein A33-like [Alosa pseudoharengus]|uniref:zinc-binding protein A33-like n=1 Tax=Alosa pseudoharengus TaxID=34774 RepID=UPI003F8977F0